MFARIFVSVAVVMGFIAGLLEKYEVVYGLICVVFLLFMLGFFDDE